MYGNEAELGVLFHDLGWTVQGGEATGRRDISLRRKEVFITSKVCPGWIHNNEEIIVMLFIGKRNKSFRIFKSVYII